jgi:hypothetical protein
MPMPRTVRCKFRCNEVNTRVEQRSRQVDDGEGGKKYENYAQTLYGVKMTPVYSDKPDSENKKFWEFTPCGSFEMASIHEGMFEPGTDYYVDITPAEE